MPDVVNLASKLAQVGKPWTPHVVAELNDYHIKVVRLEGEFVWHKHTETDELFLVLSGSLKIRIRQPASTVGAPPREEEVRLGAGELFVVPQGLEHCPVAEGTCQALLIEPAGTLNTGDAGGARTVRRPPRL